MSNVVLRLPLDVQCNRAERILHNSEEPNNTLAGDANDGGVGGAEISLVDQSLIGSLELDESDNLDSFLDIPQHQGVVRASTQNQTELIVVGKGHV